MTIVIMRVMALAFILGLVLFFTGSARMKGGPDWDRAVQRSNGLASALMLLGAGAAIIGFGGLIEG